MKKLFALALGLCPLASADAIYNISLTTSPLTGNAAAPFAIDYQLVGNLGAIVGITGFNFGGGGATGTGNCTGFCTGDLSSGVQLTADPSGFFNEFYQTFTPGSVFSFQLTLSNIGPGTTPDEFSFAILDQNLNEIPMLAGGNGSLVTIDLTDQSNPAVTTYGNDPNGNPAIGSLGNVSVTPVIGATPEPATAALLGLSLVALGVARSRKMKTS
jgi:hypothetical protein